jgi:hypothetical protein
MSFVYIALEKLGVVYETDQEYMEYFNSIDLN